MPTLLREATPVSRGRVRCDICQRRIAQGVRYHQQTCAYDGVYQWRECHDCREAMEWVNESYEDFHPTYVMEWACDCLSERGFDAAFRPDHRPTRPLDTTHHRPPIYPTVDENTIEEWWDAFVWLMRTSPLINPECVNSVEPMKRVA